MDLIALAVPFFLLALLNSKLLSYLFRTRFAAKRLGGGYMAVNKGQLAKLPIAISPIERLAELSKSLTASTVPIAAARDDEIDQLVYQLYGLSNQQIAAVERHFAELGAEFRRAA